MDIIKVVTVDADVVVILLGKLSSLPDTTLCIDLWVRFMGKDGQKMYIKK